MATILLTWELGGGLGHLMELRPIAAELTRRGHRVVAALRDLSQAREILGDTGVVYLQAPFKHQRMQEINPCCTFAHILHNIGFGNVAELTTMVGAWRQLFDFVRPNLFVFDHSPTALLAARGFPARKALIGPGFTSPPDVTPLPNLRTWLTVDHGRLRADEAKILENINVALMRSNQLPLQRVAELYAQVDENFLLTFRELDCYPQRVGAEYWFRWSEGVGQPPQWPPGIGRKIFGYLKPFPEMHHLLHALCRLPNPTLLFVPGIDPRMRSQFQSEHVRYADGPVEMSQAGRECDLAILNGTFASAAAMLLAGKPTLHIPIFLEHATTARAVEQMGAGICAPPNNPAAIIAGLRCLLALDEYTRAARKFAARYAGFDPVRQLNRLVNRVEELATSTA